MKEKASESEKKLSWNNMRKALIGLGIIILVVIVIVGALKLLTLGKNVSTDKVEMREAGSNEAVKYALRDIPEEAVAGVVKTNELSCNSKEVIDYCIVVVECNTSNEKIIEKFESKKIYYTYKKSDNEKGYEYYISKSKNLAVDKLR